MKSSILPLDFKAAFVLFLGLLAGQMLIGLLAAVLMYVLFIDYGSSPVFTVVAYAVSMIFPVLFYYLFILKPNHLHLKFDFKRNPIVVYLLVFPLMFGMMLISEYVVTLIPTTGAFFGPFYESFVAQMASLSLNNYSLILLTVILAPILEEVLFRGIIQKSIIKKGVNPRLSILISSLIFGAFHIYPWQFVGAFMLGLILGLVYEKTQSLWLSILLHAFNNLIAALLMINYGADMSRGIFKIEPLYSFMIGCGLVTLFNFLITIYFRRKASIFD